MLLLYAALIRVYGFINPLEVDYSLETSIFDKLSFWDKGTVSESIVSTLLVFLNAVLINRICIKNHLERNNTLIPGMAYILLVSIIPDTLGVSPELLGSTFLILSVGSAFGTYNKRESAKYNFNMGFFIGLAGLIYPPYWIFLIFGFFNQFVLRSYNLREIFQFLMGTLSLVFITYVYHYSENSLAEIYQEYFSLELSFPKYLLQSKVTMGVVLFFMILIFMVILNGRKLKLKKSVHAKKKFDLLQVLLLLSLVVFLILKGSIHQILAVLFPLSILISYLFLRIKNTILQELIHLAILVALFIIHFDLIKF